MRKSGWLKGLLIVGLAALAVAWILPEAQASAKAASVSAAPEQFPEFSVKTLDGQTISLAKYRGKIVLLDLFASWCPPCRMEIPQFVELQAKYAKTLSVVGLSYDEGSAADLKKFVKKMNINYDVYWGNDEIARFVGMRGIPHTLLLNPRGQVVGTFIGFHSKGDFEQAIQDISREKTKP